LASRSPQRRAILEQLGITFEVRPPDVEERVEGPAELVALENAVGKARSVAENEQPVLGVDTVVCLGGRIYDKPPDADVARATLGRLAGCRHTVVSGVCLIDRGRAASATARTLVEFRPLDRELIDWYVAGEEWRGRAGGYAIQGRGMALVRRIEGDYSNVVGLPVPTLLGLAPWLLGPEPG
jgi:nucleoside triphosphate pyrophosphatase